jgi:SH3-like domain-containing protein
MGWRLTKTLVKNQNKIRFCLAVTGVAAILAGLLCGPSARADEKDRLPLPRFVSMKHGLVNLRVGPGKRYPVQWVLQRKGMPVEIIGEFDTWRKIRDWQGDEGWVIEQAVSGERSFIVTGEIRALHSSADPEADIVARLEPGVIGKLLFCPADSPDWCRVDAGGVKGWLQREQFWGVLPGEMVQPQ